MLISLALNLVVDFLPRQVTTRVKMRMRKPVTIARVA